MAMKLSASGEWILPSSDVPSIGPVECLIRSKSASHMDYHICYECSHSYRSCECKSCLKCGIPFMKYFGTCVIKGRSHCRMCSSPVCITCIVTIKGLQKICTRCHLKQKEEEISTEKALSAIGTAKFGLALEENSNLSRLKTMEQKTNALFDAAKKGHDHVVVTLLNFGCDVNSTDSCSNTPLFYAAEGGFLQCVALLLEKGGSVKCLNNVGWTLLHAAAWGGFTDSHFECVELLLEMGADILAVSNAGETAADVADRCGSKCEIAQILRSAEVEIAMVELEQKATLIIANATNTKDNRFGRLIFSLLKFIRRSNKERVLCKDKVANSVIPADKLPETSSLLDPRITITKQLCEKCGGSTSKLPKHTPPLKRSNNIKPQADIEPILRSSSSSSAIKKENFTKEKVKDLEEKIEKLTSEKSDWEDRCRKLMASFALSNKEHQKQIEELHTDMKQLKNERDADIVKCEGAYANKLSKICQETEFSIRELEERLEESNKERLDLFHLQKNYKLSWVPDEMISECQHSKCRTPFSKTIRKHHCRCCGRVFCSECSQEKINLSQFGYTKPVRVCNTCFALVDDIVIKLTS